MLEIFCSVASILISLFLPLVIKTPFLWRSNNCSSKLTLSDWGVDVNVGFEINTGILQLKWPLPVK